MAVLELPTGHIAQVPFLARDEESAARCVKFSLSLLGYPYLRIPDGDEEPE